MIVCYGMQIWLITRLCGFLRLYEVLKWFTPCWTSDFSRYMMQDMILDLLQSVIPRSWNYWVFGVGDSQQDLVPPIRFYNGFHLININQCYFWKFCFQYNVGRCDMIMCYGMQIWLITGLCGFFGICMNLWGSEMVYPMLDQWFFQGYHEGYHFRPSAVCNPLILGLLGILGGWSSTTPCFHHFPPIRFYNGFHLINALFVWNLMLINLIW